MRYIPQCLASWCSTERRQRRWPIRPRRSNPGNGWILIEIAAIGEYSKKQDTTALAVYREYATETGVTLPIDSPRHRSRQPPPSRSKAERHGKDDKPKS